MTTKIAKLRKTWCDCTAGIPANVVASAMNEATPGINWRGCSKLMMERAYIGEDTAGVKMTDAKRRAFHKELVLELESSIWRLQRVIERNKT